MPFPRLPRLSRHSEANRLTRGECNGNYFRNWVVEHQTERAAEVKASQAAVGGILSVEKIDTVMAKPMGGFQKVSTVVN